MIVRANTLGSPAAAFEAGLDMSLLGGGRRRRRHADDSEIAQRHPREGKVLPAGEAQPAFWSLDDWSFGKDEFRDGEHGEHYESPVTPM